MMTAFRRGALPFGCALLMLLPQAARPQGTALDVIAPSLRHEVGTEPASAGTALSLSATVTDNVGVARVTLYHRVGGANRYQRTAMQRIGSTDMFVATLDAGKVEQPGVEYYIEAADAAGNVLLFGYSHSPLTVAVVASEPAPLTAATATPPGEADESNTWIWVLVGVGVAALAAGGSSGGGGGGSDDGSIVIDGPLPQ